MSASPEPAGSPQSPCTGMAADTFCVSFSRASRVSSVTLDMSSNADEKSQYQISVRAHQSTPSPAPLHPWSWPTHSWARLHLDFAGPVNGRMFLVLIDVHSKWIEAINTASATSTAVIEELRSLFAKFGLPETIVTDNGTCFVSTEFEDFLQANGIKHITSAPYNLASNGLAERAVQVVKVGLCKIYLGSVRTRLAKILFTYQLTPQTTTGLSPAEMLLGRRSRSRLDLIKPYTAD